MAFLIVFQPLIEVSLPAVAVQASPLSILLALPYPSRPSPTLPCFPLLYLSTHFPAPNRVTGMTSTLQTQAMLCQYYDTTASGSYGISYRTDIKQIDCFPESTKYIYLFISVLVDKFCRSSNTLRDYSTI